MNANRMGASKLPIGADLVNKIPTCSVAVISNSSVCNVCVFHTTVFSVIQWFAVLRFLV